MQVRGDALIRDGRRTGLVLAGPTVLPAYGFTVNLTRLDFGRLMGLYIAVPEPWPCRPSRNGCGVPVLVGGTLVVAGGPVLTLWRAGRTPSNGLRPAPIARPWNKWHKTEHYFTLVIIKLLYRHPAFSYG